MTKILSVPIQGGFIQSNMEIVEQNNISIYSVSNGEPVATTATTITCNTTNPVFCDVAPSKTTKYNTISRVIIKLVKQSGTVGANFTLYAVDDNYNIDANKPVGHLTEVTKDGVTYCIADVTSRFFECNEGNFKVAIVASAGQIVLSRDGTEGIEVQFITDNDLIQNVGKLEKSLGHKGAYSLNTRNGKLLYTQQLYQSKGGKLPFALSMSFNPCDAESVTPNNKLTGLKGWIFNYDQSLYFTGTDCVYLDGQHRYHTFKQSTNSVSTRYDCSARNGATMFNQNGRYIISDGQTTSLDFADGRLVTITSTPGTSSMTTTISRNDEGKITSVTDGMGDVYNFAYFDTSIVIRKGDISLVEMTLDSGKVTSIFYPLEQRVVSFTYNSEGYLASVHDSLSKEKVEWDYSQYSQVCTVRHYITYDSEAVTESYHLEYGFLQTLVNMCRNSATPSDSYSAMLYVYAMDGQLVNNYEVKDELKSIRFNRHTDYTTAVGNTQGDVIVDVTKYENEEIPFSVDALSEGQSMASDAFVINTNQVGSNLFMLSAQAQVNCSSCCISPEVQFLELLVKLGDTTLCRVPFDVNKQHLQVQCGAFALLDGEHELTVEFWANGLRVYARFNKIQIRAMHSGFTRQCINVNTQANSITEHIGDTAQTTWFDSTRYTISCESYTVANVRYTTKDYALTLISRLQNPSSFNLWYNDGENMFSGITGASLTCGTGMYGIGSVKCATASVVHGRKTISYIEPSSTYFYQECCTKQVNQVGVNSIKQVNANFQTVKVVDEHGISTEYTYDTNGSVTKVVTTALTGGTLNIEENHTYTGKNLLESSSHMRYYTPYSQSFVYGDDYELTKDIQPNTQETTFAYSADKLTSIASTLNNQVHSNVIGYQGDLVDTLSDTRTVVDFDYDERHNISQAKIASTVVLSKVITYNQDGTTQSVTTYGNGQVINKYYDEYNRLIKVSEGEGGTNVLVKYIYSDEEVATNITEPTDASLSISASSKLRVVIDATTNTRTVYSYDSFGQLSKAENADITTTQITDEFGRVSSITQSLASNSTITNTYQYVSNLDDTLISETAQIGSTTIATTYARDGLQRPTSTTVMQGDYGHKTTFSYIPTQTRTWVSTGELTPIIRPESINANAVEPQALNGYWKVTNIGTTPYVATFKEYSMSGATATLVRTDNITYDANGNITKYGNVTYEYDKLGRLIRENNPHTDIDKTTTWCYDVGGNIVSRTEYDYTTGDLAAVTPTKTFTYIYDESWKDQLVEIKKNGVTQDTFDYDNAGNPTTYKGASLTWECGRNLANYHVEDDIQYFDMCYDASGKRVSKRLTYEDPAENEVTTYYIYNGNNLVCEKVDDGGTISYKYYLYNSQGVIGYVIGSTVYTYRKNLFGDIVAIYEGSTKVAEYAYDAWGNCTIVSDTWNIGASNPFRYRGYYWDNDLQLYYLMSRYYDPLTGRFINADTLDYLDPESINGLNLYAYCYNNPTVYTDPSGHDPEWWQWALFAIGAALVLVAAGMAILGTGGVMAFGMGALIGSLSVGAVGAGIGAAIGYATNGVDGILGGALAGFGIGAIVGFAIGGSLGYASYTSKLGTTFDGVGELVQNPKIEWKSSHFPHLGEKMAERNISANLIKRVLKNGYAFKQTVDKYLIIGRKAAVVITTAGEVITTWGAKDYGSKLIDALRSIIGF